MFYAVTRERFKGAGEQHSDTKVVDVELKLNCKSILRKLTNRRSQARSWQKRAGALGQTGASLSVDAAVVREGRAGALGQTGAGRARTGVDNASLSVDAAMVREGRAGALGQTGAGRARTGVDGASLSVDAAMVREGRAGALGQTGAGRARTGVDGASSNSTLSDECAVTETGDVGSMGSSTML